MTPLPAGGAVACDALTDLLGAAALALLGEASHGTHEFYEQRAAVTRRLVEEHDLAAVALEGDWPSVHRLNCFVRGVGDDPDATAALGGFERFPRWMWANSVVRDFLTWLRDHNDGVAPERRVGIYGLDLYALHESAEAVVRYLERIDPEAAARARARYGCFDHGGDDSQAYGYAVESGLREDCEDEVVAQLVELRAHAAELARHDGRIATDDAFFAERSAALVHNAERYYRTMFRGRAESWNLRDGHMADTLDALHEHLTRSRGAPAKVAVWAHNSHVGDARATDMAAWGELNLGQLVRERHGDAAAILGFTTHHGTVTAARDWDGPAERRAVRPALHGSLEHLLHETGIARGLVRTAELSDDDEPLLHRAIGVIYRPETERQSHYLLGEPRRQFDVLVHIDETSALQPLHPEPGWAEAEAPDTYPSGV